MKKREVNPVVHFSAGGIGGFLGVIVTSPIELLKTRRQSSISSYSRKSTRAVQASSVHAASVRALWGQIVKQEGYRSLFKGLTPSLAAVVPSKAMFFVANSECRKLLNHVCSQGQVINLTAGTVAGSINALAMNPFWVVKTKLQLDEHVCTRRNLVHTTRSMWNQGGMRAFLRGASASVVGSFEYGLYFLIYEELKLTQIGFSLFHHQSKDSSYLPIATHLSLSACIAKIIANTFIYPTEVIRTRLREDLNSVQKTRRYHKFLQTLATVYREEGLAGLYSGWTLQLYRSIPFTIITFLVYEAFVEHFGSNPSSQDYSIS